MNISILELFPTAIGTSSMGSYLRRDRHLPLSTVYFSVVIHTSQKSQASRYYYVSVSLRFPLFSCSLMNSYFQTKNKACRNPANSVRYPYSFLPPRLTDSYLAVEPD